MNPIRPASTGEALHTHPVVVYALAVLTIALLLACVVFSALADTPSIPVAVLALLGLMVAADRFARSSDDDFGE